MLHTRVKQRNEREKWRYAAEEQIYMYTHIYICVKGSHRDHFARQEKKKKITSLLAVFEK